MNNATNLGGWHLGVQKKLSLSLGGQYHRQANTQHLGGAISRMAISIAYKNLGSSECIYQTSPKLLLANIVLR